MTMARANWRAASASTDAIAGPSRRCRCQSSGRFSVRRSIDSILLRSLQRLLIERAPGKPGDPRRELGCLARRHDLAQRLENPTRVCRLRRIRLARGDDQDEFALHAFRLGAQPAGDLTELHSGRLFEFLRELAADRDLALGPEAPGEVLHGLRDPVRGLVQDQRTVDFQRFEGLPAGGGGGGREAREQKVAGAEAGRKPANKKLSAAKPAAEKAAAAAFGPGTGLTLTPARCAASTSSAPGSDSVGVAAPLASARFLPSLRRFRSLPEAARSLC